MGVKTTPEERKKIADRYAKLTPSQKLAFMYGTERTDPPIWPDEKKVDSNEKKKPDSPPTGV